METFVGTNVSEEQTASIFRAVCFSEMLVSTYEYTRRHNVEQQHRRLYDRQNFNCDSNLSSFPVCFYECEITAEIQVPAVDTIKALERTGGYKHSFLRDKYLCLLVLQG